MWTDAHRICRLERVTTNVKLAADGMPSTSQLSCTTSQQQATAISGSEAELNRATDGVSDPGTLLPIRSNGRPMELVTCRQQQQHQCQSGADSDAPSSIERQEEIRSSRHYCFESNCRSDRSFYMTLRKKPAAR